MKKTYRIKYDANTTVEREVNYIPLRYILAVAMAVFETVAVVAVVLLLCAYVPYFYLLAWATEVACIIHVVACDEAPDYKIPWLLVLLVVPVAGFMLYFMFGNRKLKRKFIKRLEKLWEMSYKADTQQHLQQLREESPLLEA